MACFYCEATDEDLRPYGPNGAWVCFDCAMKPENKAEVQKNFHAQLEAAAAVSNVVIIGETTGPRPLNSNSLV
jgi:hypothetical protein